MTVIWLYLVLESSTVIYSSGRVTPVTLCRYKEYHTESDKKYNFYIGVNERCPPYVRHKKGA